MAGARMNDGQVSEKETKQRLQAALRGAFAGPPTPLKDIPKRNGESRRLKRQKAQGMPKGKGPK